MKLVLLGRVLRINHWFKNLFVIAGWLLARYYSPCNVSWSDVVLLLIGVLLACMVSSVNYMVNEATDARYDRLHPYKKDRPIASGLIKPQELVGIGSLMLSVAIAMGFGLFNYRFGLILAGLFGAGIIYNVPPIRTKDIPFLDTAIESMNFPIRLSLGWFLSDHITSAPNVILIVVFWTLGAMLMTGKRVAEVRRLGDLSKVYRPAFRFFSQTSLLLVITVYALSFFISFTVLSLTEIPSIFRFLPFILLFIAWFLSLSFRTNSLLIQPEQLIRSQGFFLYTLGLVLAMGVALFLG